MNQFEHDTNGTMAKPVPLFASNLLALFYVLRKSFNERRALAKHTDNSFHTEEK